MEGEDGGQLQAAGLEKKAKLHSNNIGDGLENTSPDSSSDARKQTEDMEGESSPALKGSDSLMVGGPRNLRMIRGRGLVGPVVTSERSSILCRKLAALKA